MSLRLAAKITDGIDPIVLRFAAPAAFAVHFPPRYSNWDETNADVNGKQVISFGLYAYITVEGMQWRLLHYHSKPYQLDIQHSYLFSAFQMAT